MLAKLFVTTESRRKHSFVTKSTQARDLSEGIFSFFWDYSFSSFGPNLLYRRQSHGYCSCSCFFRGLFCHFKHLPLAKLVNNFHLTAYSWLNPENPRNLANVCQKKWMEEDVFSLPAVLCHNTVIDFQFPLFVNGLQHHSYVEMRAFRRLLFVYIQHLQNCRLSLFCH